MDTTSERKTPAMKPAAAIKKASPAKPVAKKAAPAKARTGRGRAGIHKPYKAAAAKTIKAPAARKTRARAVSAARLLGVHSKGIKGELTTMEWVSVIRHGVSPTALDNLSDVLSITTAELSDTVDISLRTLRRRKGAARLDSDETGKLVRVARVFERAEEVFESPDEARAWLKTSNAALSGQTPMSLLDTEIGAQSVLDTLGRIEHGVFA